MVENVNHVKCDLLNKESKNEFYKEFRFQFI